MLLNRLGTTLQRACSVGLAGQCSASSSKPLLSLRSLNYKTPTRDILFCLNEVLHPEGHFENLGYEGADAETLEMVLQETSNFAENVLAPMNQTGDEFGCKYDPQTGDVQTAPGFKDAYNEYVAGGWVGLSGPKKYGGTGLPPSWGFIRGEIIGGANWSWGMFPGLSMGAANTLVLHASEEQKQEYLSKLLTGEWTGTMCLTEPHCGTDLGQCKTRALPQADGSFKITGTKIFISCGEHDFTDNIVHIVLAKLPDAPQGTDGISLFLVPKYLPQADGTLSSKKNVVCGGVESKMGIHASPTCIMNFDDATGWMIGAPNTGLKQMFTFMNTARIGVGLQGVAAIEQAYQTSLPYVLERKSTRALSSTKYPNEVADPLIVHGDIRRMLLTQKALAEGGRCFMYSTALLSDWWLTDKHSKEKKREMDDYLGFFTPILKGFMTEMALEAATNGMQIWGGHGFVRQNGLEQIYRDARIASIYEGTTGIQGLDLLGRKVLGKQGKYLRMFTKEVRQLSTKLFWDSELGNWARALHWLTYQWEFLTFSIALEARKNADTVGSNSFDYLMYSGYITLGYYWLRMAETAKAASKKNPDDQFYKNKLHTASFYFEKLLPRTAGHYGSIKKGTSSLFLIPDNSFKLD